MDCSTPGFPVLHHLPELAQTHVHRVGDAIQASHPLSSPSPPALSLSQHQGLFQWVSSSHQVAKILEFQLQLQSFQWIFRTNFLKDGVVGSPCSPKDSQESSPTPQFKSINSLALSLPYGPTLGWIYKDLDGKKCGPRDSIGKQLWESLRWQLAGGVYFLSSSAMWPTPLHWAASWLELVLLVFVKFCTESGT